MPACTFADRLITIPTGSKIPFEQVRFERYQEISTSRSAQNYLGIGIGKSFDAAFRTEYHPGMPEVGTFDLNYNYIAPITDLVPGISVGFQDLLNRTRDGRRYYLAITIREANDTPEGAAPVDFTIGAIGGRHLNAFVGVSLPFTPTVRLLVEHNGNRISSGLEVKPQRQLSLRLLFQDQDVLMGFGLQRQF